MDNLIGKRIRLIDMPNDPCPIPTGTTGTVQSVTPPFQGSTQVMVKWDNDRTLSLVVPPDRFEVIE